MKVLKPHQRDLGGFAVMRALPHGSTRMVGPFIFFDQMGPADFAPGHGIDVRPHPHIGLATVTYLLDGALEHRDSLGTVMRIEPGAVNWMRAGAGIVHSERSPADLRERGHRLYGLQIWVALPADQAEAEPFFEHTPATDVPRFALADGVDASLIAGEVLGFRSPVTVASPLVYLLIETRSDGQFEVPLQYPEQALFLIHGQAQVDGAELEPGDLALLDRDTAPLLQVRAGTALALIGGEPVGERLIDWNFVAVSAERIAQAKADWRAQRFAPVPGETEWIPLPGE